MGRRRLRRWFEHLVEHIKNVKNQDVLRTRDRTSIKKNNAFHVNATRVNVCPFLFILYRMFILTSSTLVY